jgi:hypothetical protein
MILPKYQNLINSCQELLDNYSQLPKELRSTVIGYSMRIKYHNTEELLMRICFAYYVNQGQ